LRAHIIEKCPKRSKSAVQSSTEASQQTSSSEKQASPQEKEKRFRDTTMTKIQVIPQGVVIKLPAPRDFYHPPGKRITLQRWKELASVSLGLWVVFAIMGFFAIRMMWRPVVEHIETSVANGALAHTVGIVAALGLPVAGWVGFMYVTSATLLSGILNKELTIFHDDQITIKTTFLGLTKQEAAYEFRRMQNFRFLQEPPKGQGYLQFEYDEQTVECCQALSGPEAQILYTRITDMMTYRCHAVEEIVFGTSLQSDDALSEKEAFSEKGALSKTEASCRILHNPDVVSLTTPFFHLKHLHIHIGSYDFYQLERFLTYAVNYIGEDYLEEHVEAHLYGNPEKLDTNLRNNLMNLCKEVHEHRE
jgi:hypothetical protein